MKRLMTAYPIFVKDPYFSVWSAREEVNECDTIFWQGERKPFYGFVEVDGVRYGFLGKDASINLLKVLDVSVTAFSTIFYFSCDEFDLKVIFTSPLTPNNLELLSNPTCIMQYEIIPKKLLKNVYIALALGEELCYNKSLCAEMRTVRGDVFKKSNYEVAYIGLDNQNLLSNSNDEVGADWGYYYIVGENCFYAGEKTLHTPFCEDYNYENCAAEKKYAYAVNHYLDVSKKVEGKFLVAFDDVVSIFYFGELLKGYYFKDGKTIMDAIDETYCNTDKIIAICEDFDDELVKSALVYGENYIHLLRAGLRQSVAGHKLVVDKKGRTLFLSKECSSDGCIATLDVTYPSMPLFLFYNPTLVLGMLYPILDFAETSVWEYDFAPHDVGVYPYCSGQYYGITKVANGKFHAKIDYVNYPCGVLPQYYLYPAGSAIYEDYKQMPIEESGNILILAALAYKQTNNKEFINRYFNLFAKWAKYLAEKGLKVENQLCTDDFSGHQNQSINLSIKSIVGLGAFSILCEAQGEKNLRKEYYDIAKNRADELLKMFVNEQNFPLTFLSEKNTYSIKYNLLGDRLLETNLFTKDVLEREVDYYLSKANEYGFPLDSVKEYTKSDWLIWAAALSDDKNKQKVIIDYIIKFVQSSSSRVPFSDWYNTKTGVSEGFKNRTVQGAMFVLLLKDKMLNQK